MGLKSRLVSQNSNLRLLKFGKDLQNGGNSNQPYVTTPLPGVEEPLSPNSPDYILRQGVLGRIKDDETRFFKYFTSTPGLAFITKQNVLSLTSVETEASKRFSPNQGTYLPTSTSAQLAANPFGGHLNFLGADPTGLLGGIRKYEDVVKDNNRLDLNIIPFSKDTTTKTRNLAYQQLILGLERSVDTNEPEFIYEPNSITGGGFKNRLLDLWWGKQLFKSDNPNILSYKGGPGAAEGIGKTNIKFAVGQRTGINNPEYNTSFFFGTNHKNKYYNTDQSSDIKGKLGVSSFFYKTFPNSIFTTQQLDLNNDNNRIKEIQNVLNNPSSNAKDLSKYETYTQDQLTQQIKPTAIGTIREDFRTKLNNQPSSLNYIEKNWEKRTNYSSSPGSKKENGNSYTKGRGTALDEINALSIYQSKNGKADDGKSINDLIKFRIGVVDNDKPSELTNYIHFRAFIDSFSDSYGTQWTGERYPGRGEEFFRYSGFTRGISLSFTVAAQSKQELIPMYKKLNYLASATMNDYSPSGYMRAPFIKLTIGGYLYEQFGFLKSINYGWEMAAPFEIGINDGVYEADETTQNYAFGTKVIYNVGGKLNEDTSVKELPHVIRVTGFEFQPIYNFLPKRQSLSFGDSGEISSEGDEHYIALQSDNNNWL